MVANDIAPLTIAGHPFSVEGATGGMLNLRIALRNGALADLARALAKLEGVRVTSGPAIVSRGDCFLVHCPGFKMVLSSPPSSSAASSGDFAQALLSRAIEPTLAITCELAILFARLMSAPQPQPDQAPASVGRESATSGPSHSGWSTSSTLRRTALQAGKTLARKTPLVRRTPLGRGKFPKR